MSALSQEGMIALVVCTPVVAVAAAWVIVHRGGAGLDWMKRRALREFDGSVPFFDNRPVRIDDADGGVRIAADDVFAVLGMKPDAQALRRLQLQVGAGGLTRDAAGAWWFADAALLRWLEQRAQRHDRVARNLHLWLEREVLRVLRLRRAALGAGTPAAPPDHQEPPHDPG